MRYLMLLLLAANIAFFVWYPEARDGPYSLSRLPPEPPNATRLVLLSERQNATATEPTAVATTDVIPTNDVIADGATGTPGRTDAAVDASTGTDTDASAAPIQHRRLCRTVGPYFEETDARKAARALTRAKYDVRVRNGNVQAPAGYWVYLPAKNAAEARETVDDLDGRGMKDYFIGKDNVISLGIFSTRDTAEARRRHIAKLGYPAMLDQRYRTRSVFWLDLEDGDNPLLLNPVWARLAKGDPNIVAQQVSCE